MNQMQQTLGWYRSVAGRFTRVVEGVRDWDAPTPVQEWRARDVVDHLLTWVPAFLQGGTDVELPAGLESPA